MFCSHKYENSPKCAIKKAYSSKTNAKANQTPTLGQSTSVGAIQAQLGAHTPKVVARHVAEGAATPWVQPHHPQLRLAPHSLAVQLMLQEAVACGAFLKYMSKQSYSSYKRRPPLHIQEHHTYFGRRRRATLILLASS